MTDREKLSSMLEFHKEWDKDWRKLDDIGINTETLLNGLCDRMLEEMFYQAFPFPREKKFQVGDDPEIKASWYDIFFEWLYEEQLSENEIYSRIKKGLLEECVSCHN